MSRFWAVANSSDDEDEEHASAEESGKESSSSESSSGSDSSSDNSSSNSDSSSGSDSDSDSDGEGPNKFLAGGSDSDSEDERRVVKSEKQKRLDELASTCEDIRNKMKINDFSSIQSLFDDLNSRLEKCKKFYDGDTPKVYIKMIADLEDFLSAMQANAEAKKKLSPTNSKAFNTMRQRIKKHNVLFQEQIFKYRESPQDYRDEKSEEEESEEESEEEESGAEEDGEKQVASTKKDKLFSIDPKEITYEFVNNKTKEVLATRGRRGTDKREQVEMLTFLAGAAKGPAQRFEVVAQLISSLFDLNPSMANYLKTSIWKKCTNYSFELLRILRENPNINVDETAEPCESRPQPADGVEVKVWGNFVAVVERLDEELFKSLQVIDPHTHEYVARLSDEPAFLALAQCVLEHLLQKGDLKNVPKVALRLVEHYYYKTDAVYAAMRKLTQQQQQQRSGEDGVNAEDGGEDGETEEDGEKAEHVDVRIPEGYDMVESGTAAMQTLVSLVYRHGDERTKARAMLCMVYHKCIHDDFYGARDLLLMSHLQDGIQSMDVSTQIVYNRALAQLGLAAFRRGLISEAHACLNELYSSSRLKELLAQGMSVKYQEKTPEQELMEKRRQMPFHMHITLELVESVYLICAMLLEVPEIAANAGVAQKRRNTSKSFYRVLEMYNRQMFNGPPENVRETVMAATRALLQGDWSKAYTYASGLNAWNLLPQKEAVLAMLKSKLQEEALRTYLFTYSSETYRSLKLDRLMQMFDLPEKKVCSIVSRMMVAEELRGSWDHTSRTIVMQEDETSRLQKLALQLGEKATIVVELNDRALAYRTGGLRDNDDETGPSGPVQRRGRRDGQNWEGEDGGYGRSRGGFRLNAPKGAPQGRGFNKSGVQGGGRRLDQKSRS